MSDGAQLDCIIGGGGTPAITFRFDRKLTWNEHKAIVAFIQENFPWHQRPLQEQLNEAVREMGWDKDPNFAHLIKE